MKKTIQAPVVNPPRMPEHPLLVLDLDGVLVDKEFDPDDVLGDESDDWFRVGNMSVRKRPNVQLLIDQVLRDYDVGIYSSTTEAIGLPIVKKLFGTANMKRLKFTWFRDRTILGTEGFETYKLLERIWENPVINKKRIYGPKNTLIVDDDLQKIEQSGGKKIIFSEGETFKELLEKIDTVFREK